MKSIRLAIVFSFFVNAMSFAANDTIIPNIYDAIDYMLHELNVKKYTPLEEMELCEKKASGYAAFDMKNTYDISMWGLNIAEKENDYYYQGVFYSLIASTFVYQASYDSALIYFNKSILATQKVKNTEKESSVYLGIANIYARQGLFAEAVDYYMKILDLYEKTGPIRAYILALGNIGEIHRRLNNSERAVYYLEQELLLSEEHDMLTGKVQSHCELGRICMQQGDLDRAIAYELKTLELMGNDISPVWGSEANEILARIYIIRNDFDKAILCANECLRYAGILKDPNIYVCGWNLLSTIYLNLGKYRKAEEFAMKAWLLDSVSIDTGPDITFNITQANIHLRNLDKASVFLEKNELFNKKKAEKSMHETLLGMEIGYETEKKEMRIMTLEKDKRLYLWLGTAGIIVLFFAFSALLYRHRLSIQRRRNVEQQHEIAEQQHELAKQKIKQLEKEKQLIATQSLLEGETTERSRLARDLHDGLGGMLSVVKLNLNEMKCYSIPNGDDMSRFSNALNMLDQSIGELRRVAHHMMPESLMRYGLKVSLDDYCRAIPSAHFHYFGTEERLDERLEVVLYRCAYELINNAVKYAEATIINVQLIIDHGLVSLTIHDDGIGFDPEKVSSGSGLDNIRTRVSTYNGNMTIHSLPGKGTEVNVEIEGA